LNGTGELPFDTTLHDALQIQVADKTFFQEIKAGGLWIWPILIFAITSFVAAGIKAYEVFSIHNPKPAVLQDILQKVHSGQSNAAQELISQIKGPFRPLMENAIQFAHTRKELLEEILFEKMLEAQPQLERFLPFIAVTAAATPLLGLLGTVTGMILTFDQITLHGTSDAGKLAAGISEALVTTKFGLIAAIPSLILHALLSRRVQGILAAMEKFSTAFINGLESKQS
jgi:biopolymer transport protein ExbB